MMRSGAEHVPGISTGSVNNMSRTISDNALHVAELHSAYDSVFVEDAELDPISKVDHTTGPKSIALWALTVNKPGNCRSSPATQASFAMLGRSRIS